MQPKSPSPYSQVLATCPYPEPTTHMLLAVTFIKCLNIMWTGELGKRVTFECNHIAGMFVGFV
jgi:hypothetical protein